MKALQQIAKEQNGKCLSVKYINKRTKLKWQCSNGHQWLASPTTIKSGRWCRRCYADSRRGTMKEMQAIAKQRGENVFQTAYIDNDTNLMWQCSEGHTWSAKPSNISNGGWCRKCVINSRKLNLVDLQEMAVKRAGMLLSKEYVNTMTKLHWQCANGHRWWASANDVKHNHWCGKCYHDSRRNSSNLC